MTDRELMQQALEALETVIADVKTTPNAYEALRQAITALRERLAQPETVMAEYKFQTYAAYKTDGEMKIGVVPEQEQKPVAWMEKDVLRLAHIIKAVVRREKDETYTEPLYTSPQPRREWVGLTDEEIVQTLGNVRERLDGNVFGSFARAIEAKLREKNGGEA